MPKISESHWSQKLQRFSLGYSKCSPQIKDIAETFKAVEAARASFLIRDWHNWHSRDA